MKTNNDVSLTKENGEEDEYEQYEEDKEGGNHMQARQTWPLLSSRIGSNTVNLNLHLREHSIHFT